MNRLLLKQEIHIYHYHESEFSGQCWFLNMGQHRGFDRPAVVNNKDKHREWWLCGMRHRGKDNPAVILDDGTMFWFCRGLRHRDNDKPAIVFASGEERYFSFGVRYNPKDKK